MIFRRAIRKYMGTYYVGTVTVPLYHVKNPERAFLLFFSHILIQNPKKLSNFFEIFEIFRNPKIQIQTQNLPKKFKIVCMCKKYCYRLKLTIIHVQIYKINIFKVI